MPYHHTLARTPSSRHHASLLEQARGIGACIALTLLAFGASACSTAADRPRPDSAQLAGAAAETIGTGGRLASDGTLTIEAAPSLHPALRAVADGFASREAVRVVLVPPATDSGAVANDPLVLPLPPDLVVAVGDPFTMARSDSTLWVLPFARRARDSTQADTARADSTPPRSARRTSRAARARDSVRAQQRADSLAAAAAADSARVLTLTMPGRAANSIVAERFVRYLMQEGRLVLSAFGLEPLPFRALYGRGAPAAILELVDSVVLPESSVVPPPPPGR